MQLTAPADAAKLVRAALKAQFPGIRFSVKTHTYAGGAHLSVKWTGGPAEADVITVTSKYEGKQFDATTDCTTYREDGYGVDYVNVHRRAA